MGRGLEKALDQMDGPPRPVKEGKAMKEDVRRVLMRERRAAAWRHLHVMEKDVLTVLSAVCKVELRERLLSGAFTEP